LNSKKISVLHRLQLLLNISQTKIRRPLGVLDPKPPILAVLQPSRDEDLILWAAPDPQN